MKHSIFKYMLTGLVFTSVLITPLLKPAFAASDVDILVRKLVEKKLLSPMEAQQVMNETKEEATTKLVKGEAVGLPKWIQTMALKGSLRLRYQWQEKDPSAQSRERGRFLFKLGIESKVNDQVNVGVGFVTGSADPRSGNQTMENFSQTSDLRLDYAYAAYTPFSGMTLTGGQMNNPLWRVSGMLWDSDIMPQGVALNWEENLNSDLSLFLNAGAFVLDEYSASGDPIMVAVQPGLTMNIVKNVSLKTSFNYYGFSGLQGKVGEHRSSPATNSVNGSSQYLYDYDAMGASAEIGIKNPFGEEFKSISYLAFFGDYIETLDPKSDNTGWLAGIKLGHSKVSNPGDWQLVYTYRNLEKDAWLDSFPDSDFYSGATDVKGSEVKFQYGLLKNTTFGLGFYQTQRLSGLENEEQLFMADLVFKF